MEGKRAAAIVALCMLMLLSGQQQVEAMSKFCACYNQCYNHCRRDRPRLLCLPNCVTECSPFKEKVATPTLAADCSMSSTDTSGAAACVDDCTKNRSQYAKHL